MFLKRQQRMQKIKLIGGSMNKNLIVNGLITPYSKINDLKLLKNVLKNNKVHELAKIFKKLKTK